MGKSVSHSEHHWAPLSTSALHRSVPLSCPQSKVNSPQNSTCFDREEWILLRLCLEKCYSQVIKSVGTFFSIKKFSFPPVVLYTKLCSSLLFSHFPAKSNPYLFEVRIFIHPDSKLFGVYLGRKCKLALFLLFHMGKKQPPWWSEFRFPLDCLQINDIFKHFILWLQWGIIRK